MADASLEVVAGPGGRRAVAARPTPPGGLLLRCEPYAAVLLTDGVHSRCWHTFEVANGLKRCGKCKVAHYSSRAAQAADWAAGHQAECAALASAAPRLPPPTVRLAARVLWRGMAQGWGVDQGWDGWGAVQGLEGHWDALPDARKAELAGVAALTVAYMRGGGSGGDSGSAETEEAGGQGPDVPAGDGPAATPARTPAPAAPPALPPTRSVARLLARLACNVHTICDAELRPLGLGLYPLGAMLNHCDAPTAAQSFVGRVAEFRATRPLAPGEEATIAYVDLLAPRPERRAALAAGYRFDLDAGRPQPPLPLHAHAAPSVDARAYAALPSTHDEWRPHGLHGVVVGGAAAAGSGGAAWWEAVDAEAAPGFDIGGGDSDADDGGMDVVGGGGPEGAVGAGGGDPTTNDAPANGAPPPPGCRTLRVDAWGPAFGPPHQARLAQFVQAAGAALTAADGVKAALAAGDAAGAAQAYVRARAALDAAPVAPAPGSLVAARLDEAGMHAAVEAGAWGAALDAARRALPAVDGAHPPLAPPRALHLAALAKLEAHMRGDDATALGYAEEAAAALRACAPGGAARAAADALAAGLRAELAAAREAGEGSE